MYVIFDIGATKTRISVTPVLTSIGKPVIIDTPQNFDDAMREYARVISLLAEGKKIKKGAAGVPGVLDTKRKVLLRSPNLKNWIGKPLAAGLSSAAGCAVSLENDAALCALGEARSGAGRGFEIVEYLTVSTGVGGARIVNGTIDEHSVGFEPGQAYLSLNQDGTLKTLENTISGRALEERFGKKPKEIHDEALWEELARELAVGVYNTIVHWSPDVVVLGGSMITGNPAISISRVNSHLSAILKIFPKTPILKQSELGAYGGLWGALHFLKQ